MADEYFTGDKSSVFKGRFDIYLTWSSGAICKLGGQFLVNCLRSKERWKGGWKKERKPVTMK